MELGREEMLILPQLSMDRKRALCGRRLPGKVGTGKGFHLGVKGDNSGEKEERRGAGLGWGRCKLGKDGNAYA